MIYALVRGWLAGMAALFIEIFLAEVPFPVRHQLGVPLQFVALKRGNILLPSGDGKFVCDQIKLSFPGLQIQVFEIPFHA